MVDPAARWAFVFATLVLFAFGAVLTVLSFVAYRRSERAAVFRVSTAGFGFITAGSVIESVYQFTFNDFRLVGRELFLLQALEGAGVGVGLGLLFYSIYRYNTSVVADPGL